MGLQITTSTGGLGKVELVVILSFGRPLERWFVEGHTTSLRTCGDSPAGDLTFLSGNSVKGDAMPLTLVTPFGLGTGLEGGGRP